MAAANPTATLPTTTTTITTTITSITSSTTNIIISNTTKQYTHQTVILQYRQNYLISLSCVIFSMPNIFEALYS